MSHKIYQPHLSTASDARAVRTREALRTALLGLLETTPLEQITIRDIAAAAGIGYTTFFRHHPSKESLLDEVAAEQMRQLIEMVLPVVATQHTRAGSEALFRYVDAQRALWTVLLTGGAAAALRDELLRISREIAAAWPKPRAWPPVDVVTLLIVSSTIELLAWWLRQREPISIEDIADIHSALVIAPATRSAGTVAPRAGAGQKRAPREKLQRTAS